MASLLDTRRTRFTDASGRLHDQFKQAWDSSFISAARKAGVPEHWLLPNGAELPVGSAKWELAGSMDGAWTDLVYTLDCCLRGTDWADHRSLALRQNIPHVVHCFDWMHRLLDYCKIERSPAIVPYEVYQWRLQHYRVNRWELPEEDQAADDAAKEELEAEIAEAGPGPFVPDWSS